MSKNSEMRRIFQILPAIAQSRSHALITGPSGTGKELIARAIHNLGPRRERPFIAVNCGALPDTLIESELFGYKRGAFTDARRDKPGRIAHAEGGVLFLDEIGDLSLPLQVKILRFLQDQRYEPLGATGSETADVRVISATHRDLERLVRDGGFREDLYYRLNVVQIQLPPLHERLEDIPLLVQHFIDRFRHATGKSISGISDKALAALAGHDYPGNVRELENIIERAFIMCRGSLIALDCLPERLRHPTPSANRAVSRGMGRIERAELESIRAALELHQGNRTQAARDLGIHRNTLLRKMKRYGLV